MAFRFPRRYMHTHVGRVVECGRPRGPGGGLPLVSRSSAVFLGSRVLDIRGCVSLGSACLSIRSCWWVDENGCYLVPQVPGWRRFFFEQGRTAIASATLPHCDLPKVHRRGFFVLRNC